MKNIMYVIGVVFVLLGLLGFVNDPILGIFEVDTVHNLIHLATGILALIFTAQGEAQGRKFFLIFGVVYALVTILGFLGGDSVLGITVVNGADNVLHLLVTVVFLVIGLKKPASGAMSSGM